MDIHRAYKIFGLEPGASKEEVHGAFRDLVQVWHPDKFAHDEKLRQKAQRNVKRINAAFQVLKDYEPPPEGIGRPSLISATFGAIQDLGDMVTAPMDKVEPPAPEDPLLAAAAGHEESARFGRRRRMQKENQWVSVALLVSAVVVLLITILLFW